MAAPSRLLTFCCLCLFLYSSAPAIAQETAPESAPYLNPDLPIDVRVRDLVSRMTLEEKVSQMVDQAPAIERLGIHEYNWWNEALHGVARAGLATVFPQAIGLAATWNAPLIHDMATLISDEARAKHHEFARRDSYMRYQGLTIWSPNINILRDPRWGRGMETYGEDPFLSGALGVEFVRGLQGDDPNYLKTVATVKHLAVHSGPEPDRHHFDAVVGERDLRETYLPHFERGIREGGSYSLMCAYNRVNGEPACGSPFLMNDLLRGEWGFDGFTVSDCWAVDDIFKNHQVVETPEEAAALAVKSGTDLDCGSEVYPFLVAAVEQGLITEAEIDTAVERLFTGRMKLGMFDPPERVPYAQIPYSVVDSEAHQSLALDVARQSMVLLKNDGTLPLSKDLGSIAVIGPNADNWLMLLGNYKGIPSDAVTPLRGIREAVGPHTEILHARGADLVDGFPHFEVVPADVLVSQDDFPGLRAEYFDNFDLDGEPVFEEHHDRLDANWHDAAPRADLDDDNFGVRWTGTLRPHVSGEYHLGMIPSMRFELYLDGELVLESQGGVRNEPNDPKVTSTDAIYLEAGRGYDLRVDAGESYGDAMLQFVWSTPQQDLLTGTLDVAEGADAVVLFLGLSPELEGEEMDVEVDGFAGGDRTRIDLPDAQQELLEAIIALGKPTVLVLLNGSALAINWADENVPAILEAWYPGQAAGTAIADVLFGDYNPAGRLPVTFYHSVEDLPPFDDYDMTNRTYRFFEGEPLYAFGHGLSYTSFEYGNLTLDRSALSAGESATVSLDITNTGGRDGDEVVQLYVSFPGSTIERPRKELKGFARVSVPAGDTARVDLPLKADDLRFWDVDAGGWALEPGEVTIMVGASSADVRLTGTISTK